MNLVLALTEDTIIQSEPEKQDKNQVSAKKFKNLFAFELEISNASDTETKVSQRVRF